MATSCRLSSEQLLGIMEMMIDTWAAAIGIANRVLENRNGGTKHGRVSMNVLAARG
jgi:hypothetical protein